MQDEYTKDTNLDWRVYDPVRGYHIHSVPALYGTAAEVFIRSSSEASDIQGIDASYLYPTISTLEDEMRRNRITINNLQNSLLKLKEMVKRQKMEIFAIKKNLNLEKIYRFSDYKEDWDGYGAPPFDKSVIERAVKFIFDENLKIQPNVFPTGRGSIQLEFEPDDNHYLEIEIFKDRYNLLTIIEAKEEELSDIDFKKIIQKVNDFQSRFCS